MRFLSYILAYGSLIGSFVQGDRHSVLEQMDTNWVPFNVSSFTNSATNADGSVVIYYSVTTNNLVVRIGVASKSAGWLALGLSENGGMVGADIALFYKNSAGQFTLEDRFASGESMPILDKIQNLKLISGYQFDNYKDSLGPVTAFIFERRVKSCKDSSVPGNTFFQEDQDFLLDRSQFFIYAFGNSNSFGYHGNNKGAIQFNVPDGGSIAGSSNLDLKMSNVTIDPTSTQYCFQLFDLPSDKDYWVIGETPLIASKTVHHVILWSCPDRAAALASFPGQQEKFCQVGFSSRECYRMFVAWGIGADARIFPSDQGKPFGKSSQSTTSVLMEVHYSDVKEAFVDQSGLRLSYTSTPRTNSVGMFMLGTNLKGIALPPGKSKVTVTGFCNRMLLTQMMQVPEVTLVAALMHMHGLGRGLVTRWQRDGAYINELSRVDHYDFDQQFQQLFLDPPKLRPTDTLFTTCQYDTSGATGTVYGGHGSADEMCFNFIEYYPLQPYLIACLGNAAEPVGADDTSDYCGLDDWNQTITKSIYIPTDKPTSTPTPRSGAERMETTSVLLFLAISILFMAF